MKFILMMHTPEGGPYQILQWPQKELQAHMAFQREFNATLQKNGELVGVEGLVGPNQARLVRAGKDRRPFTDGVFPESKEYLAGFWIVDVDSPERAYQLAAEASLAPGPDGKPLYTPIEVRQVMFSVPSGAAGG